ncbi:hypothetical protein JTB14_015406 [Gonioctena quinquepunctata]|nr:hypothetical protein JTB14_015406 [Gonioctena quinquepunctata]
MITTLNTYVNKCFPLKQRKQDTPTTVKFFNEELRHKRDTLSALITISASSRNPQYIKKFKSYRKHYNSFLKCAKREAYDDYIKKATNISRNSWRFINYECNSSQSIDTHCDLTADEFSDYYPKVAENIINELPFTNIEASDFLKSKPRPKDSFILVPLTLEDIITAINELKKIINMVNNYFVLKAVQDKIGSKDKLFLLNSLSTSRTVECLYNQLQMEIGKSSGCSIPESNSRKGAIEDHVKVASNEYEELDKYSKTIDKPYHIYDNMDIYEK